jgi:hypothetical protein
MNGFMLLTLLTGLGTIVSFASGVRAMIRNGQVGHRSSAEWMAWRVVFQGAAFVTVLAALLSRSL